MITIAGRIPEAFIEEVRQKTNIVDVVSQYVQLKKQGKNLFGLCPFHEEKTPSFSVTEDKQIFNCFSCHRGGNVFKFIMDIEDISFPEAVLKVADFSDISLPQDLATQKATADQSQAQQLRQLYQDVQVLYTHILLKTKIGEPALDYLQDRQLDEQAINEFGLGFAPDQSDLLLNFLKTRHVSRELMVRSGLFAQRQDGQLIDRFRNRVMFPIWDQSGRVIAFSGRLLTKSDNEPKYLNSPETEIFQKRDVLYHFAQAKREIRQTKTAYLFEGFMDVISAYRAGVTNGIASMGTSLTSDQLYLLSRAAQRLIICYDGDEPGQNAIADALKLVKERPFEIGVVMLPDGQDPDEYIKAHGAEAFQQQLEGHVLTPVAFELQRLAGQYNFSVDNERLAYVQSALQTLVTIESTVEQDLYLRQVADQANVDLTALKTEFTNAVRQYQRKERAKKRQTRLTTQQTSSAPPILNVVLNRTEISERRLLNLAIGDPTLCQQLIDQADFAFNNPQLQTLFENWQQYLQTDGQHDVAGFADFLTPDQQPLLMEVEMMPLPDEISDAEINDYIHNIQTAHLDQRLKNAQQQVKRAAEQGDGDAEMKWLNELLQLKRQLSQ
ncbi:DNA primase DnaG [Lapidilactobacillus dextrinicus DSM 20335]|uniref:DNA primase n=1 Tax=Lapidilactobacillus dextrinicus DSM 20335 TaxID=1423738 RepID=A0A0R2BIF7_9LACO|nr:DNA primase [Lapidilactobacillus dextrinicus]KRM79304.1 DNA primase DnaG [Lapidilactobacillus dextrinicus DSM 20335]QFG46859.1 DNA primase [Lapidilactobacillus dextrinicus]